MNVTIVAGAQCTGKTTLINTLIEGVKEGITVRRDYPEFDEMFTQRVSDLIYAEDDEHWFLESQDERLLDQFDEDDLAEYGTDLRLVRTWIHCETGDFIYCFLPEELLF